MDIAPTIDPRLPPELECLVFEEAAFSYPAKIPTFMLTAWRVKNWLEPILYRIVLVMNSRQMPRLGSFPTLTTHGLRELIATKSPSFIQDSIKHLYLRAPGWDTAFVEILMTCTRLTSLFAQFRPMHHMAALCTQQHLRRLAIELTQALEGHPINEPHPLFRHVTHLELLDSARVFEDPQALPARLACMPALTHVAFNSAPRDNEFYEALCADARLQCVVFLSPSASEQVNITRATADDARFVCVKEDMDFRLNWVQGVDIGDDYWAHAEVFIAARRAGRVPVSFPNIISNAHDWNI
ncbi:hypothetical protein C8R46DRAFT_1139702 [Mycena filopes]|nr:hypothetical protein C8R46DRAFT_1139702 [Mycena filopes]